MNKVIEEYLHLNSSDRDMRYGRISDGERLRREIARRNGDESQLLTDIDSYSFDGDEYGVSVKKTGTETFLNTGLFSFRHKGNRYIRYDAFGSEEVLTDDTVYRTEVSFRSDGSAYGVFHIPSDDSDRIRDLAITLSKNEVMAACRRHRGQTGKEEI